MESMLRRLISTLLAAIAILVLVELGLRFVAPIRHSLAVEYEPDGYVRTRLAPNRSYHLPSGGSVRINAWGFRGPVFEIKKPAGVFRIVALGGSSTFCFEADDAKIWTALLQEKLRAATGTAVEVINAGVPGYSAFESKLHYLYRIRNLAPDAVILYHTWNDLKYFHEIEEDFRDGELRRSSSYDPEPLKQFLRHFQLAWRARALAQRFGLHEAREDRAAHSSDTELPIPEGGAAHRWVRQNFDDLTHWLLRDGALPILITEASLISEQTIADSQTRAAIHVEYQTLDHAEVLAQWQVMRRLLREVAAEHGVPFVDAYAQVPHSLEYFFDHVHLTEAGNARLAEVLAEALLADPIFRSRRARANFTGD